MPIKHVSERPFINGKMTMVISIPRDTLNKLHRYSQRQKMLIDAGAVHAIECWMKAIDAYEKKLQKDEESE